MIARVTLEIALRKEFDYFIPPELADQVDVGSRVQVPFGARKVLGCVTGAGRGIGARQPQAHPQSHRRADAGHAQGSQARALDRRLLLLRAGDRAEERAARSRAPGAGRLARAAVRARPAGRRRIAEAAQAAAGSLEHHRRTARTAADGIARTGRNHRRHRPPPGRPRAWSTIATEISERDPYAREHILPDAAAGVESGAGQGAGGDQRRPWTEPSRKQSGRSAKSREARHERLRSLCSLAPPSHPLRPSSSTASPAAARPKSICRPSPTRWSRARAPSSSCRKSRSRRRPSSGSRRGSVPARCKRWSRCCTAICPPASGMTNGTRSARAARASSSARARRSLRPSNRSD